MGLVSQVVGTGQWDAPHPLILHENSVVKLPPKCDPIPLYGLRLMLTGP